MHKIEKKNKSIKNHKNSISKFHKTMNFLISLIINKVASVSFDHFQTDSGRVNI